MRYAQIRSIDISDGPGIRVAIYTQGCRLHCDECHNESIWDFHGGHEFSSETIDKLIELTDEHIDGLSILGGEPLDRDNYPELASLVHKYKLFHPDKTIWLWTGYTIEYLAGIPNHFLRQILEEIDVLVDGPWKKELFDMKLKYRGSSNQRVIDMKKTMKKNKVILYEEDKI